MKCWHDGYVDKRCFKDFRHLNFVWAKVSIWYMTVTYRFYRLAPRWPILRGFLMAIQEWTCTKQGPWNESRQKWTVKLGDFLLTGHFSPYSVWVHQWAVPIPFVATQFRIAEATRGRPWITMDRTVLLTPDKKTFCFCPINRFSQKRIFFYWYKTVNL